MAFTPEHAAALKQYASTHNGKKLDQEKMLKPSQMVEKILIARIMHMTPEQQGSLKAAVNAQSAEALKILLPELSQLIDKGVANGAAG